MANKKMILSGTSGFVGQNLVPYLKNKSFTVSSFNLREPCNAVEFKEVYAIIHLAGKAHDHKGTATEAEYFHVNTELTKVVFDAFIKSTAKVFIHFSSVAAITDESVEGALTEDALPHPTSPYGKSKLAAEQYLLASELPEGKKVFIIRPAMIHGPGDKGNLTLLYKIVAKGIPYPLAAFKNKRSFLGIDNLCFAIEKLLLHADAIDSGIYNLVDDEPLSTTEVVEMIANVLGKKMKMLKMSKGLVKLMAKIGDVIPFPLNSKRLAKLTQDFVVSNSKIKKALNITRFPISAKEGLTKTIRSFQSK